jgi:fructosamine-3-kinase
MKFVKQNHKIGRPILEAEKKGLEEIKRSQSTHHLRTPKIDQLTQDSLILEKIETKTPTTSDWQDLARGMAKFYLVQREKFGFDEDNFIGDNPQRNRWEQDWGSFFLEHRLGFQASLIRQKKFQEQVRSWLNRLKTKIKAVLSIKRACLCHGDLWSGNVIFDEKGPVLIDPAVYYGDPLSDLAMTQLFGGFAQEFYQEYASQTPKVKNQGLKIQIYQLYHLLNHYNLFGGHYLQQTTDLMEKIEHEMS